jgi:type IV pilus assembly protein PilN
MIRINLLPVRAAKKRETAKQQLAIFVLSMIGVLAVFLVFYTVLVAKTKATKDEVAQSENDLKQMKAKIGEIENIKKLQQAVKKKLDVLNQLRKEKAGPLQRLIALSDAVPDRLWLTKYAENGTSISISGVALNEDLIASFMQKLQATNEFAGVELLVSEQVVISGTKAKRFDMNFSIKPQPAQEAATSAPKK